MREIKFRAWDKFSNSMINVKTIDFGPRGVECAVDYSNINGDLKGEWVLEQYTGLKDKNGVEIYEGDIVCQQMRFDETNGVIFWQEEKSRFAINLDGFITTITKPQEDSYEVVGNIHEKPELLEGTK